MPIFQYYGLSERGEEVEGLVDADNAREARSRLRVDHIHVTRMVAMDPDAAPGGSARGRMRLLRRQARGSGTELVIATRQMSVLLAAGIPLAEALTALIEQAETRRMEAVLRNVRERIVQGASFADALAAHPGFFSELYVNMVRAGEASGALDEILGRLADYLQKQARIYGKVRAALTYPTFMVIIAVAVVAILMTVVVPRILAVLEANFSGGTASLPVPTRVLITVSGFFKDWWWLLLIALVAAGVVFRVFTSTPRGRKAFDRFKLNVWVLGPLYRKAAISRFSVTLSTLLRSGLPVTQALLVVKDVVGNVVISEAILDIHDRIVEGADIATPVKESGLFPPVVGYMVAIGEQSGQLDDILERLAEAYDEELEQTSTKVTSILEPCLIVAMAFVVGGIVFAIILPMLEIANVNR